MISKCPYQKKKTSPVWANRLLSSLSNKLKLFFSHSISPVWLEWDYCIIFFFLLFSSFFCSTTDEISYYNILTSFPRTNLYLKLSKQIRNTVDNSIHFQTYSFKIAGNIQFKVSGGNTLLPEILTCNQGLNHNPNMLS